MTKEKKIELVKTIAILVASAGVSAVVGNIAMNTIPRDAKTIGKISACVGGFVLSGIASDLAGDYVEKSIDDGFDMFDDIKDFIDEKVAEEE